MNYGDNVMDKGDTPEIVRSINLYYNWAGCLVNLNGRRRFESIVKLLNGGERAKSLDRGDIAELNQLRARVVDDEEDKIDEIIKATSPRIKTLLSSSTNTEATQINFVMYALSVYPFTFRVNNDKRNILVNMDLGSDSHGDMTPCEYLVQGAQYSLCGEAKDCKWEFTPSRSHLGETADGVRIVREGRMVYGSSDTSHAIRRRD
jgi:hypothetical protein